MRLNTIRDTDGRYSHSFERLCRCGHTKGQHVGEHGTGECIAHEVGPDGLSVGRIDASCGCMKFRLAPKVKVKA